MTAPASKTPVLFLPTVALADQVRQHEPAAIILHVPPESLGDPLRRDKIAAGCEGRLVFVPLDLLAAYRGDEHGLSGLQGQLGANLRSLPLTLADVGRDPAGVRPILQAATSRADADDREFNERLASSASPGNPALPPVGVLLSGVEPETVTWLWPGYIPRGKLSILDGDPGLGKSTLALDLAARLTRGHAMPDGSGGGEPGDRKSVG